MSVEAEVGKTTAVTEAMPRFAWETSHGFTHTMGERSTSLCASLSTVHVRIVGCWTPAPGTLACMACGHERASLNLGFFAQPPKKVYFSNELCFADPETVVAC